MSCCTTGIFRSFIQEISPINVPNRVSSLSFAVVAHYAAVHFYADVARAIPNDTIGVLHPCYEPCFQGKRVLQSREACFVLHAKRRRLLEQVDGGVRANAAAAVRPSVQDAAIHHLL